MNVRVYFIVFITICIIAGSANINAHTQKSNTGSIWHVGGTGPENITSITEALSYSSNGDIIFVHPGIYYENVVLNASVALIGINGADETTIDGNKTFIPLIVNSDNCFVSGFSFRNPGDKFKHIACASLRGSFCNFSNNLISMKKVYQAETKSAVEVAEGFSNIFYDNIIRFDDENPLIERGILIRNNASKTEIAKNNISRFGVGIQIERKCNDTNIFSNSIFNNSNGIISYGEKSTISHNNLYNNTWWGITIQDGKESKVIHNRIRGIMNEDSGIMVYSSSEKIEIFGNDIRENGLYGIYLVNTKGCYVTENNLIECNIHIFKHLETIFRKNTIVNNYYSKKDTNILGWQKITGELMILAYFEATWEIPWKTFDKKPSQNPFISN